MKVSIFFGVLMFLIVLITSKIKLRIPLITNNDDTQKRLSYFAFGISYGLSLKAMKSSFWIGYFVCIGLMFSLLYYSYLKAKNAKNDYVYDIIFQYCAFAFILGSIVGMFYVYFGVY